MQATVTIHRRFYERWWDAVQFAAGRWKEISAGAVCICGAFLMWFLIGWRPDATCYGCATRDFDSTFIIMIIGAIIYLTGLGVAFGSNNSGAEYGAFVAMFVIPFVAVGGLGMGMGLPTAQVEVALAEFAVIAVLFMLIAGTTGEWIIGKLPALAAPYVARFDALFINTPKAVTLRAQRVAERKRHLRLRPYLSEQAKGARQLISIGYAAVLILGLISMVVQMGQNQILGAVAAYLASSATAFMILGIGAKYMDRAYNEAEQVKAACDASWEGQPTP